MKKIITRQISDVVLNQSDSSIALPIDFVSLNKQLVLPKDLVNAQDGLSVPDQQADKLLLSDSLGSDNNLPFSSSEITTPIFIPESALNETDFLIASQVDMMERLGIKDDVSDSSFNLSWSMIGLIIGATAVFAGGVFLLFSDSSDASATKKKKTTTEESDSEFLAADDLFSVPDVSITEETEETEVALDDAEDESVDEQNDKQGEADDTAPVSRNIEAEIAGESPYPISKAGFFFEDDDGDPLRGLVIKSLPDEGELKLGDDAIEEGEFLKISSLDDIDDLDITYQLEEGDSASSFEFTLVSGDSVVDQLESENYTYTFIAGDSLAGPSIYAVMIDASHAISVYDYPPINDFG